MKPSGQIVPFEQSFIAGVEFHIYLYLDCKVFNHRGVVTTVNWSVYEISREFDSCFAKRKLLSLAANVCEVKRF